MHIHVLVIVYRIARKFRELNFLQFLGFVPAHKNLIRKTIFMLLIMAIGSESNEFLRKFYPAKLSSYMVVASANISYVVIQ